MTSNANINLSRNLNSKKRAFNDIITRLNVQNKQKTLEKSAKINDSSALDDSQTSDYQVNRDNNYDTDVNFFVDDVDDDNNLIESFPRLFNFNINRLVSNFDIIGIVKMYGRKILRNDQCISTDDKTCLTNSSTITKGSFARVLNQWCEENKVTKKATLELLTIMQNSFGHAVRLPVTLKVNSDNELKDDVSTGSQEMLTAPTVQSTTLEDYDHPISRFFAFQQCFNDCTVYIGDNYRSFQCKVCSSFRFKPCVRMNCANRGKRDCEHLLEDGVPSKQFFYRPLILLILDLVRTKWFVKALNYKRKDFRAYYDNGDSYIADGTVAEEHLNNMKSNFQFWKRQDPKRSNFEAVNILLSEFYDGAQLFKRRQKDFNCLITSIINLPPTYRGKEGIATFTSAVYEGKHRLAEQVIFSEMYVEELQTLLKGIEFQFEGKQYFIQARLVLHIMDTKAAEGVYKLQNSCNSVQGCPNCELIYGIHEGSKCIYPGHRHLLPLNHFLRPIGQSKRCCPTGFYSENLWYAMESFDDTNVVQSVHEDTKKQRADDEFCLPCDGDKDRQEALKEMYNATNSESKLLWYHTGDFSLEAIRNPTIGLKKILFYRHYDFRDHQPYERYSYDYHMRDALQAEALTLEAVAKDKMKSELALAKSAAKKKKKIDESRTHSEKKIPAAAVNGIKGVWPFGRYRIADFSRHSGPPAIHAMSGSIRMLLDIILGKYKLKDSKSKKGIPIVEDVEEVEEVEEVDGYDYDNDDEHEEEEDNNGSEDDNEEEEHIERNDGKYKPEFRPSNNPSCSYSASAKDSSKITYWLRCVLLPKGMSDDSWSIRLDSIGSLKMNQKLKVLSCFWDLMLLACPSIHPSYKMFYRMFADDLKQMQSLYLTSDIVDHIQKCILETISSWEGALPPKTLHYRIHQLVDLPSMFKNFGTVLNFGEFGGERMMGLVKNHKLRSNTGGCSYGNTIMRKQIQREMRKMNKFYSRPVNEGDRHAPNGKHLSILDNELIFNDFPFSLGGKKTSNELLNSFEIAHLVELLLFEIQKIFSFDEDKCIAQSVLYRLIKRKKATFSNFVPTLHGASRNTAHGEYSPEEISVAESLMSAVKVFHYKACIYGLEFCSRGGAYREKAPARSAAWGEQPHEKSYDVRRGGPLLNWYEKSSYSSWCMFRGKTDKIRFGQLNGFFKIEIGDPVIDGLLVASVTTRRSCTTEHIHFIEEHHSLDPRQNFVSLQDICPTLIGIVPFHRTTQGQLKAISLNPNINNTAVTTDKTFDKAHIYTQKENIYAYAIITLHPERISCQPCLRPFKAFY